MKYWKVINKIVATVYVAANTAEDAVKRARAHIESGNAAFTEPEVLEITREDSPAAAALTVLLCLFLAPGLAFAQQTPAPVIPDPSKAEIVFTDDDPTVVSFLCRVYPITQTTTVVPFQCGIAAGTSSGVTTYTQPLPAGLTDGTYVVSVEACATLCSGPSDPFTFVVDTGTVNPPPPPPPNGPHKPTIVTVRPIAQ